jgi:hypothetical protein
MLYNLGGSKLPAGTLNAWHYAQGQFPEEDLHWVLNDDWDCQQIEWYLEALLGSMK